LSYWGGSLHLLEEVFAQVIGVFQPFSPVVKVDTATFLIYGQLGEGFGDPSALGGTLQVPGTDC